MSRVISKKEMKNKRIPNPAKTKDLVFCLIILFLPVLNFLLFNIGNYANMIRLALDPTTEIEEIGIFSNFVIFWEQFTSDPNMMTAIENSLIFYGLGWAILPLALFTSYYIFRKFPGRKYFQFMLMLPGMIAGMVWIMVYKYFMDLVLPDLMGWKIGLLTNGDTKFLSLIIYSLWFSLGGGLLIYTGMMGSVSNSVLEAGRLDGMNKVREFWHILMPAIYPVFVINTVSGLIGLFTNGGNTFEFFGLSAPSSTHTIGYIMFQSVMGANPDYGFNSAGSLLFTLIVAPIALIVKRLMEKYGPSED